jgi:hypothetical protein
VLPAQRHTPGLGTAAGRRNTPPSDGGTLRISSMYMPVWVVVVGCVNEHKFPVIWGTQTLTTTPTAVPCSNTCGLFVIMAHAVRTPPL